VLVLIDVHNPFPMKITVDHGQEQFYYKEAADKAKEETVFVAQGIPVQMHVTILLRSCRGIGQFVATL
jgi:hypothetical protein